MTTTADLPRGAILAGYRVEALLGRGGMGVVYLATDSRLERKVALKLIAPELAADGRFRERFLREARLAASLDHSHVLPVYEVGESDGRLFLAMRYVDGPDLGQLLRDEAPLEAGRALGLCDQIADALDAAHGHGLVHRDVKPANVLVGQESGREHCYLSDFGLADNPAAWSGSAPGPHLSGTVDYTAPEQIGGEPPDGAVDEYSLGCVLYECLVGEPPFRRPRASATLFGHASEAPPSLHERRPELPEGVDSVIARALAKEPGERYESCKALVEAAREALGLTAPRFSRRQLLLAGTGALVALAAAGAIPAVVLRSGDTKAVAAPPPPPPPILPVTADSLVRIDPETGKAVAAVATGSRPVGVAAGGSSLWVIGQGDRSLSEIDPEANAVVRSVKLPPGESAEGIAVADGAVWTRHTWGVRKYDPATSSFPALPNEIEAPEDVQDTGAVDSTYDIAAGHGSIWLTTYGPLYRVDPATGKIAARISTRKELIWLAIGEDAVWLAEGRRGSLARIDPATNALTPWTEVSSALHGVAIGEGAVWALNSDEDLVLRIDPSTLRVTDRVRVSRLPTALAAGAGAVWVTSERDGTLTRIDPVTIDVETIDLGGSATDVAVGHDSVWVTVDVR